jgi:pyridoxamine 5'-phosphate oxidase
MDANLAQMRYEYTKDVLHRSDLDGDPLVQFQIWFDQISQFDPMGANAFTLSSVNEDGRPTGRIILLKGIEEEKFVFYTNYGSRKAVELESSGMASMCFFWGALERQLRIEGTIERVSPETSDAYFSTRPRESQIGAHVSPQSDVISDRSFLENRFEEVTAQFEGKDVSRPDNWGGYALDADYIEFWQGRASRLHDRFAYTRRSGVWQLERLAP